MSPNRLTPAAESDLAGIWFYTVKNCALKQVDDCLGELIVAFGRKASQQANGRKVEIRAGYFKYKAGSHVIFFRNIDGDLEIVRRLHQSLDFDYHL